MSKLTYLFAFDSQNIVRSPDFSLANCFSEVTDGKASHCFFTVLTVELVYSVVAVDNLLWPSEQMPRL